MGSIWTLWVGSLCSCGLLANDAGVAQGSGHSKSVLGVGADPARVQIFAKLPFGTRHSPATYTCTSILSHALRPYRFFSSLRSRPGT